MECNLCRKRISYRDNTEIRRYVSRLCIMYMYFENMKKIAYLFPKTHFVVMDKRNIYRLVKKNRMLL